MRSIFDRLLVGPSCSVILIAGLTQICDRQFSLHRRLAGVDDTKTLLTLIILYIFPSLRFEILFEALLLSYVCLFFSLMNLCNRSLSVKSDVGGLARGVHSTDIRSRMLPG